MKSGRKSTSRTKLKDTSQQEILRKWKVHFRNLPGNPSEITDKTTEEIFHAQLNIKLGHFTEELDAVLKGLKSRKDIRKLV